MGFLVCWHNGGAEVGYGFREYECDVVLLECSGALVVIMQCFHAFRLSKRPS